MYNFVDQYELMHRVNRSAAIIHYIQWITLDCNLICVLERVLYCFALSINTDSLFNLLCNTLDRSAATVQ